MSIAIRTLIVEDSEQDAELIINEFRNNGITCCFERVDTAAELKTELSAASWDLVLCDYRMPGFSANAALAIWKESRQDIPFIIVSGAIGEQQAVEIMRLGARDFVHKENLRRLIPVVQRELEETNARREREKARAELEELRVKHELILNSALDGVIGVDRGGTVIFINRAAEEILGYSRSELVGKSLHEIVHHTYPDGSAYPAEKCFITDTYRGGRVHHVDSEVFWRKDGSSFQVEYSSNPMRDEKTASGAVIVFRDITEKKKAEADREAAIRARDELLATVSHDLKNPLGGIDLNASMLIRMCEGELSKELVQRNVVRIKNSVSRMTRLITDLLDVTRIEAGGLTIQASVYEVGTVIQGAIRDIGTLAESRKVRVEYSDVCLRAWLACDAERLSQVFSNLLGNAIKFAPNEGGIVEIGCDCKADEIIFKVSDNGPGIPSDEIAHVFDRFWRSRLAKEAGAGLGLAIAEGIVRAHGGKIWAESVPGHGATFLFSIPTPDSYQGRRLLDEQKVRVQSTAKAS